MIAVKYLEKGGPVSFKITISVDLIHWAYKFKSIDAKNIYVFEGNSEHHASPRTHSLGFTDDLIGERDYWQIELFNSTNSSRNYEVKIEWFQGERILSSIWGPFQGTLEKETGITLGPDKAWLIS